MYSSGCASHWMSLVNYSRVREHLLVGQTELVRGNIGVLFPLDCDCTIAPLIVIFTKRDSAALKETSRIIEQMMKESSVTTISRSAKNRARGEADRVVMHRINELEAELRDLSQYKDTLEFLTAGGKLLGDRTLYQPFNSDCGQGCRSIHMRRITYVSNSLS
jgi:hypothetical protein